MKKRLESPGNGKWIDFKMTFFLKFNFFTRWLKCKIFGSRKRSHAFHVCYDKKVKTIKINSIEGLPCKLKIIFAERKVHHITQTTISTEWIPCLFDILQRSINFHFEFLIFKKIYLFIFYSVSHFYLKSHINATFHGILMPLSCTHIYVGMFVWMDERQKLNSKSYAIDIHYGSLSYPYHMNFMRNDVESLLTHNS
jgi:hypothetical protein